MTLPNFLIIGAPKGGTTTLHNVLSQHPDVFMCPVKEAGFFWASGRVVVLQGPGADKLRNRLITDLAHYESLFGGVAGQKAVGESSVRYLYEPGAPALIHRYIPTARLIAVLRQPAERAYSAYLHNVRDGLEPCSSFADALAQEHRGLRDDWEFCRYLSRGNYGQSLERYFQLFDRSQMHISLFEDLKADTPGLVRRLFSFLEVDEDFTPDATHRHNASGIIRNRLLRFFWTNTNRLRSTLRPLLNPQLRHSLFEWVIRDLEKPAMDPAVYAELTEYYHADILHLQDLLQRDLSAWLAVPVGASR